MYDYATCALAFAAAARLALHDGDVAEADSQLTRAMRARPTVTFALPISPSGSDYSWPKSARTEATSRPPAT